MIISLSEAQTIDGDITQEDLDAFEISIRELTNNNFQNTNVRFTGLEFSNGNIVKVKGAIAGLRAGDTLEVNNSLHNDGLYEVVQIIGNAIEVATNSFYEGVDSNAMLTKVEYPADIKTGVKKLIAYDVKMRDKIGIKSKTVSRMSTTYYDVNSSENIEGYPSGLLSFTKKYEKMRW